MWHHKLLYAWCAKQLQASSDLTVQPSDAIAAHPALRSEVPLAVRCGSRFGDALCGAVAYQELLFPGGSMEAVLPVYEDAPVSAFYNECVVAAVKSIIAVLPPQRSIVSLEIGAGSGGTASSVLPTVKAACTRYIFTDVSEVFMRKARARFAQYGFVEYTLLNIDADVRLQGFACHECDVIIGTNVLHATPFMRNTLHNLSLIHI